MKSNSISKLFLNQIIVVHLAYILDPCIKEFKERKISLNNFTISFNIFKIVTIYD